jgi:hypothetical protein
MSNDWIPSTDEEFDDFYKTCCQKVTLKTSGATPAWTHIPAAWGIRTKGPSGGTAVCPAVTPCPPRPRAFPAAGR